MEGKADNTDGTLVGKHVGDRDGCTDGKLVEGDIVGLNDGIELVGDTETQVLGANEGEHVDTGDKLGLLVGITGSLEGKTVLGIDETNKDGAREGEAVANEGEAVGLRLGEAVLEGAVLGLMTMVGESDGMEDEGLGVVMVGVIVGELVGATVGKVLGE